MPIRSAFFTPAVRTLIQTTTPETRARVVELIKHAQGAAAANYGDPGLEETFEDIRNEMRRFSEAEVVPHAQEWHLKDEYIPLPLDRADERARRVLADAARGVWRARTRQGGDVRRLRGAVARLYRRRLARHALGDRRGADPERRHRRAEAGMAAADRERRDSADGGVHRAEHRLGPRLAHHPRRARRRCLSHHRPEDLDHARRARRPDDRARAHRSRGEGLSRAVDVPGAKAARHRRQSFPGQRHDRAARSRCSAIAA